MWRDAWSEGVRLRRDAEAGAKRSLECIARWRREDGTRGAFQERTCCCVGGTRAKSDRHVNRDDERLGQLREVALDWP